MSKPINAELDLVMKRELAVPSDLVWRGLTDPELLKQWFCPKPWMVTDCRLDLRPGGEFYTVMADPDGNEFPGAGCILEVVEGKRFSWTSALVTDYRPAPPVKPGDKECANLLMTAIVSIEPDGAGTKYTAHVMHNTPEHKAQHLEMGFEDGWGTAVNQLEELLKEMV